MDRPFPPFWPVDTDRQNLQRLFDYVKELTDHVKAQDERIEKLEFDTPTTHSGEQTASGRGEGPALAGTKQAADRPMPFGQATAAEQANFTEFPLPDHLIKASANSRKPWQQHCNTLGRAPDIEEVVTKLRTLPFRTVYRPDEMALFWQCSIYEARAWAFFGRTFGLWIYQDKPASAKGNHVIGDWKN